MMFTGKSYIRDESIQKHKSIRASHYLVKKIGGNEVVMNKRNNRIENILHKRELHLWKQPSLLDVTLICRKKSMKLFLLLLEFKIHNGFGIHNPDCQTIKIRANCTMNYFPFTLRLSTFTTDIIFYSCLCITFPNQTYWSDLHLMCVTIFWNSNRLLYHSSNNMLYPIHNSRTDSIESNSEICSWEYFSVYIFPRRNFTHYLLWVLL